MAYRPMEDRLKAIDGIVERLAQLEHRISQQEDRCSSFEGSVGRDVSRLDRRIFGLEIRAADSLPGEPDESLLCPVPCPFCGSLDAGTVCSNDSGKTMWNVECENCAARTRDLPSEATAIEAWNQRDGGDE